MKCRLLEDQSGWALTSLIPTHAFEYDRQTYPDRDLVVLVDGTSTEAKLRLLAELPQGALVIKTYDEAIKAHFVNRGARLARSFISFTASDFPASVPGSPEVVDGTALSADIARMFAANGYLDSEMARYFADGARWFAILNETKAQSAGFVFRNFESVWEIGGVLTHPEFRRHGLARQVVAAALRYLIEHGQIPRYQVRSDNLPSIGLAEASGLREFLRMDHLLLDLAR